MLHSRRRLLTRCTSRDVMEGPVRPLARRIDLMPEGADDPRMRGFRARSAVEDVQRWIDARVRRMESEEAVELTEAAGRVLAADIIAEPSVPSFDRAAMDGYALRGEETFGADVYSPARFRVVGQARPGRPCAQSIAPGQAAAIATGAPMPEGADAVARAESCRVVGDFLEVVEPTPPRRHVGRRGEDVTAGAVVLTAGRVLRPQDLGVVSSLALARVRVVTKPCVAILITGDEIGLPGRPPAPFCVPDMNGPMLSALVARDGGIPVAIGPLRDDPNNLRTAIADAAATSHFVIVCGGSSTGPEDHAPSLLAKLGELSIHGVALRPASPTGLGFIGMTPVLLAPGNPVSCLCAYDLFGGRIVRKLAGRPLEWPYRPFDAPLSQKLVSALGRVDYARLIVDDGRLRPTATSGASILTSTTRADGFVLVPAAREGYAAGEIVRAWLYD